MRSASAQAANPGHVTFRESCRMPLRDERMNHGSGVRIVDGAGSSQRYSGADLERLDARCLMQ
jgi:hypothetical protein